MVEQNVGGLDVAMDDAAGVGVFEGIEDMRGDGNCVFLRQDTSVFPEILVDIHPVDELHHEVELALAGFTEIEDGNDSRVIETGHGSRLLLETLGVFHFIIAALSEGFRQ